MEMKGLVEAQRRFGSAPTSKGRLEWIIAHAYRPPQTPEGWKDFERDLMYLGMLEGRITLDGWSLTTPPQPGVGKRILHTLRALIEKAMGRQRIPLGRVTQSLLWNPGTAQTPARYVLWRDGKETEGHLESAVVGALYRLILDYGHLIKKCPAPALRAKEGELCGKWFLAERPNQQYCSTRCLSRRTTRENPPKKKRRKSK